jgi:hypothetical protein
MYRIIGADGREYGPISSDQLRQWIAEGRANASTHVLSEGAAEWKPLASLPEFSLLFSSPRPPAQPAATPAVFPSATFLPPENHSFATTGLVLGIISLTVGLCCCYGLPFSVTGMVFSIIALSQIRSQPDRYTGKGMAITGLVLCGLSLLLMALLMLLGVASSIFDSTTHHGHRL